MTQQNQTLAFLEAAPNDWSNMIKALSDEERSRLADHLADTATHAAYLSSYLTDRFECSQGHRAATKEAQRTAVKVRRALDFSYPNSGALARYDMGDPGASQ
jgi:hypothetical protein